MKASPKRKTHYSQRLLHLNSKSKTSKCNTIKIEILQNTHVYYLIETLSRRKRIGRFVEQPDTSKQVTCVQPYKLLSS